ncbi:HAMP domain-containing protein, partial [bacterium]|nr:HAMP domain-containing protein [bacterium]
MPANVEIVSVSSVMSWIPKDPLSKIDIKYKLPLGFVCLYLVVFGIGGYFVINSVYAPLNQEILLRLQSESLAQATIFDKKLEMLARRAEDFASDGFIRTETEELIKRPDNARSAEALQGHLRVNKLPLIDEFVDLHIFDLDGRKLSGINPNANLIPKDILGDLNASQQRFSSIVVPNSVADFPSTAIQTPLWDIQMNRQIGYLVCVVNLISVINKTASDYAEGITESSLEKYLTFVDQNGVALEVPWWYLKRLQPSWAIRDYEEVAGVKVIDARGAVKPALHVGRHECQTGKEMFGQSYPLSIAGWSTLIELEASDALMPLSVLEGKLLEVALAVALTTLVLLFFPIQYLVRPLGVLQRMASHIKEGDFSRRITIDSEDEIGHLARTFNLMTDAIEERTRSLERTAADLQNRERELRVQHDRLQAVVHSMRDGLILLSHEGDIALSNEAAIPIIERLNDADNLLSIRKCELHESASRR